MARGLDQHRQRKEAVAGLGRTLSRRAKNRCELCEDRTSLKVVEVEPVFEDPDEERAVMICARCERALTGGRGAPDPQELRFLEASVWATVLPVQLAAVRIARRLSDDEVTWARDLVDGLYLDDEVQALLDAP